MNFPIILSSKYKRYFLANPRLVFGKKITIPIVNITLTTPFPSSRRVQVFNSFSELAANLNVNGKREYIDTNKNPELPNIILEQRIWNDLTTGPDNPHQYLTKTHFNASLIWNGRRKYFRYNPTEMYLMVSYSENANQYRNMQATADLEQSANEFVEMARRNAKAIAELSRDFSRLNEESKQAIRLAVVRHKNTVAEFKETLPNGFLLELADIPVNKFEAAGIGAIPVIVWIVGLIVTGVVIAADIISAKLERIAKQKNQLQANYDAVQQIETAAEAVNQGKITPERYNDVRNAATRNIESGNRNLERAAQADAKAQESGGIIGEVKQILIVGAIVMVAKMIFSGSNNNNKN